jgi:hypothetical protein
MKKCMSTEVHEYTRDERGLQLAGSVNVQCQVLAPYSCTHVLTYYY